MVAVQRAPAHGVPGADRMVRISCRHEPVAIIQNRVQIALAAQSYDSLGNRFGNLRQIFAHQKRQVARLHRADVWNGALEHRRRILRQFPAQPE